MKLRVIPNIENAKKLRHEMTSEEKILWSRLRNKQILGVKFRRQEPIGPYIVDFVSLEQNLVIELDGGQHNEDEKIEYDKQRTKFLEAKGFFVIRFWNNEIHENLNGVLEAIFNKINTPSS